MHALSFQKLLILLREPINHDNFKLGVQYPLNTLITSTVNTVVVLPIH